MNEQRPNLLLLAAVMGLTLAALWSPLTQAAERGVGATISKQRVRHRRCDVERLQRQLQPRKAADAAGQERLR